MRSSSIKNLTVAISLCLTLAAAAPIAGAATVKPTRATATMKSRDFDPGAFIRALKRAVQKFLSLSPQHSITTPVP
jgi:hypothetical protein